MIKTFYLFSYYYLCGVNVIKTDEMFFVMLLRILKEAREECGLEDTSSEEEDSISKFLLSGFVGILYGSFEREEILAKV